MKRCAHQVPHAAVHFRKAAASITLCTALALTACSSSDGKGEAADESPSLTQAPTSSAPADPKETAKREAIAAPCHGILDTIQLKRWGDEVPPLSLHLVRTPWA